MSRIVIAAALLIAAPWLAHANEAAVCRGIAGAAERLACYDKAFPPAAGAEEDAALPEGMRQLGEWYVTERKSKIDDSPEVFIFRMADGREFSRRSTSLHIRCVENQTAVTIFWSDYLGLDPVAVTTRIDAHPAETKRWAVSTGGKAFGLWSGSSAIPFLKRLLAAKTLAVKAAGWREAAKVETFALDGLDEAIKPVRAACKW